VKRYGGIHAVDDCSFDVREGTITALIGPNGSGKTTAFNLISGIEKPDAGDIIFKGVNIRGLGVEAVSNLGLSRLFQQSRLFANFSVAENLKLAIDNGDESFWRSLLGLYRDSAQKRKAARTALEALGLGELLDRKISAMSYGQQRMVDLARSMLNPHDLLLLDEPVAGVHPSLRKTVARSLQEHRDRGKTTLLIEHDMIFTLAVADRVIVMDAGDVIADDKPKNVVKSRVVREAYLGG